MLFWIYAAHANEAIQIEHDLRSKYLSSHPIVVTFRIHNTTEQEQTIPDLSHETWRTTFTLVSKKKKETWSNEKKERSATWSIAAHSSQQLRLEIPNSHRLDEGKYDLTVQINYAQNIYTHQQPILITKPVQEDLNIVRSHSGSLTAIWTDSATNATYYNHNSRHIYLHPKVDTPQLVHHNGQDIYDYTIKQNTLHLFGKRELRIPIPYSKAQLLSQISLHKGIYRVPIWHPPSRRLLLMSIDQRGMPSFRPIRSEMPTFISAEVSLSATGEPLYLIHHEKGVELIHTDIPKEHKGALNGRYIHKKTKAEQILDVKFGTHPTSGLAILLTYTEQKQFYQVWYSIHGTIISKKKIAPIEGTILDSYPVKELYLVANHGALELISSGKKQNIIKKTPFTNQKCRLNDIGVRCFMNGEWSILYTYSTDDE